MFLSSFLKFSLCSSILSSNLVSIPITNALNSLYIKLFIAVLLVVFFRVFLLFFQLKQSSFFSFCLTFSVSVILGETFTYSDLEGVSLCGSISMQSPCVQWL